ncbi:MAG: phytanoyl-CoA dioxygenase family protein [Iamia sp.]
MRDPGVARDLSVDGYSRLGPLLDPDECLGLRAAFDEAMRRLGQPLGDAWFPTSLLPDPPVRAYITEVVGRMVLPRLSEIVDLEVLGPVRMDYSVKPPGPASELGPHQDFSIVDERRWTSLYLWVPLVDTDATNGTLNVLPGSHRFTNRVRSRHVPARFDPVLGEVEAASTRLDCRAGELVLMTSGVIHFSPPNRSADVRLAAHGILKPVAAPLLFYYADDNTPDGLAEVYEVGIDDYIDLTMNGRPGPDVKRTALCPRPTGDMQPERFAAGMKAIGAA